MRIRSRKKLKLQRIGIAAVILLPVDHLIEGESENLGIAD